MVNLVNCAIENSGRMTAIEGKLDELIMRVNELASKVSGVMLWVDIVQWWMFGIGGMVCFVAGSATKAWIDRWVKNRNGKRNGGAKP